MNLVRLILREKKDPLGMNGKTGVVSLLAGRKVSTHFIHSVPAVRRDPQQTKGESLLAVALFEFE